MTQNEIQNATIDALTARETVLRGAILATYAPGRTLGAWLADAGTRPALVAEWQAVKAEIARRAEAEADYQAWAAARRAEEAAEERDYQAWARRTCGEAA